MALIRTDKKQTEGIVINSGDYIVRSNGAVTSGNGATVSVSGDVANYCFWNVESYTSFIATLSGSSVYGSVDGATWSSDLAPDTSSLDISSYKYLTVIIRGASTFTIS